VSSCARSGRERKPRPTSGSADQSIVSNMNVKPQMATTTACLLLNAAASRNDPRLGRPPPLVADLSMTTPILVFIAEGTYQPRDSCSSTPSFRSSSSRHFFPSSDSGRIGKCVGPTGRPIISIASLIGAGYSALKICRRWEALSCSSWARSACPFVQASYKSPHKLRVSILSRPHRSLAQFDSFAADLPGAARVIIESWRRHYNAVRPHASLDYKPPAPEVFLPAFAAWPASLRGAAPPATQAKPPTLN